jgi:hypothetical protein
LWRILPAPGQRVFAQLRRAGKIAAGVDALAGVSLASPAANGEIDRAQCATYGPHTTVKSAGARCEQDSD